MGGLTQAREAARTHLAELMTTMQTEACVVVTPGALTADGAGGWTEGTPTRVTTTCQRRTTLTEAERELAGRLAILRAVVVTLPRRTVISERSRLEVGGVTLAVRGLSGGTWSARVQALCAEEG